VHVAETRLIVREGRAIGRWRRSTVDDVGGVTIEGVEWGVEGVFEIVPPPSKFTVSWSFEARWERSDFSIVIEIFKEAS